MNISRSKDLFNQAKRVIPGGVNSPVRAFKSVDATPIFFERGKGSKIVDVDGNEYIDYVGSWGPFILGYSDEDVVRGIKEEAEKASSFGAPSEWEIKLAQLIIDLVPSVEKVRMVNSGTEATMSAIRLARGVTGRNKIIKFEGCYHGHGDSFLIKAGSGATTLGVPTSPGVPKDLAKHTLNAVYNDLKSVYQLVEANKGEIAAIIVEPVAGNMGVVPPAAGFLQELRQICDEENIILIFDEVMTGFRLAPGGAQELYEIIPDLTTMGKIIGGGLPVGAYGGKKEIMDYIAPEGPVYQAGTLSGNPIAMRAGYETLKKISRPGFFKELDEKAELLEVGMKENLNKLGLNLTMNRVGSMSCLYFTDQPVYDYSSATASDTEKFAAYFRHMLEEGIYLAPSQFEAAFISIAHTEEDIEKTIKANYKALSMIYK
ncbi:MAG: glutamate-1-semialdehyde 2,1-aminomutase [Calditrichia bacterium]